jgi:4-amino-4-deoxy-L-arabinose transferase-like glycosyltransferase
MSSASLSGNAGPRFSTRARLALLVAFTVAALLPFVGKAFCIDDPLFLWAARQIQKDPLDFYGGDVNWEGVPARMYQVMKNPPLASYYIALATRLTGWSEPALHVAFLLPAIGAILGCWLLARRLCGRPFFAALLVLTTPAFLVSSTSIMCDTSMLCLWTWAIVLWIRGLDDADGRWMAAASLLIAAAALTKYFAASLILLLAVYTIVRQGRLTRTLLWLLLPVACLGGYQWWTWHKYGVGLLSDAALYARALTTDPKTKVAFETTGSRSVSVLTFTGGAFLSALLLAPWLWSKRGLAVILLCAWAIAACAKGIASERVLLALHVVRPFDGLQAVQMGLFVTCGLLVLWLAVSPLLARRAFAAESAENWLLALWVLGTLAFAGFLNWTCNVRSVLPLAPALAILVARKLEARQSLGLTAAEPKVAPASAPRAAPWALLVSAEIALMVAWADFCFANADRSAVRQIAASLAGEPADLWFQGHWGFQYYMQADGGRAVDVGRASCRPGDFMVIPRNNSNVLPIADVGATLRHTVVVPICPWLATMELGPGAGFYSSRWGPFPFIFSPVDDQTYDIWQIEFVQYSHDSAPRAD